MWTAAFLRKSWQKLDRLYNVFLAYAEGGLDAVRQLWREITTYKRLPIKPKQLLPSFELLEDRQMPTTVQLSANAYSIPETASNVTLTATLDASSGSNVTVQYASSNGSALAGTDYTSASGTATITAGLTSTTFTVAILNYVRSSNVSFTVTLSSPTNATLGSPSSATVTIIEPPVAQLATTTHAPPGFCRSVRRRSTSTLARPGSANRSISISVPAPTSGAIRRSSTILRRLTFALSSSSP